MVKAPWWCYQTSWYNSSNPLPALAPCDSKVHVYSSLNLKLSKFNDSLYVVWRKFLKVKRNESSMHSQQGFLIVQTKLLKEKRKESYSPIISSLCLEFQIERKETISIVTWIQFVSNNTKSQQNISHATLLLTWEYEGFSWTSSIIQKLDALLITVAPGWGHLFRSYPRCCLSFSATSSNSQSSHL